MFVICNPNQIGILHELEDFTNVGWHLLVLNITCFKIGTLNKKRTNKDDILVFDFTVHKLTFTKYEKKGEIYMHISEKGSIINY